VVGESCNTSPSLGDNSDMSASDTAEAGSGIANRIRTHSSTSSIGTGTTTSSEKSQSTSDKNTDPTSTASGSADSVFPKTVARPPLLSPQLSGGSYFINEEGEYESVSSPAAHIAEIDSTSMRRMQDARALQSSSSAAGDVIVENVVGSGDSPAIQLRRRVSDDMNSGEEGSINGGGGSGRQGTLISDQSSSQKYLSHNIGNGSNHGNGQGRQQDRVTEPKRHVTGDFRRFKRADIEAWRREFRPALQEKFRLMDNARKEWREQEAVEKAKQALEEKEEAEAAAQVAAEVAADIAAAAAEEEAAEAAAAEAAAAEAAAAAAALAQVQFESLAEAEAAAAAAEEAAPSADTSAEDVPLAEANTVEDTSDATVEKPAPAEHRVKVVVESLDPCEKREEGAAQEEKDEKDEKEEEDGETEQQGVWQDISSPQAMEQAQLSFVAPDLNAETAEAVAEESEPVPQRTLVSPAILAVLNMNRKHKPASTAVEEPMACIPQERESVYMFSDDDADDDDVESDDEMDSGGDGFVDTSKTWHSHGSNGGAAGSVHDEFSGSDDDDDDDDDIIHPDFIDVLGRASTPSRFRRSASTDMGSVGGVSAPSNAAGAGLAIDTSRDPSPDASAAATTDSRSFSSTSRLSTSSPRSRANNSSFMRSPRVVQASSLSPKNNHDQSDLMDIIPDRVDLVENGSNPLWQWLTSARDVHEVEI